MPIKVQNDLPAKTVLELENIFMMDENRALTQDIRPLRILILNLMPIKEETETQLLRALSNTPLQVDISFLHMSSHRSKNTSASHLNMFYQVFSEVKHKKFDGLIITGAPVEMMEYEEVNYWPELSEIMEWSKTHVPAPYISAGAPWPVSITITALRKLSCPRSCPASTDTGPWTERFRWSAALTMNS